MPIGSGFLQRRLQWNWCGVSASPLRVAPPHGRTVDPAPAPLKKSLQEAEADRHNGSASPWHSWTGGEASEFSVRTKCEKLRGQGGTGEGAAEK